VIGQVLVVVPDTGSLAVAWPRMSLQVLLQSVLAICAHALLLWAALTSVVSLIVSIVIDGVLSGPKSQL
jgi:hypothetical protein